MIITILLWGIIVIFGLGFVILFISGSFTGSGAVFMLLCVVIMMVCYNGLERNEASQVCDAINELGGRASFVSGKCLIKNDAGIPIDRESGRYVYFTEQ